MKSAADMLAVLGQSEIACSIYLLLYNLQNIRNGPPQISMYLLVAASRSVVNYEDAEIVGRLLNERIMEFSKLRNQWDSAMDLSRPQKITHSLFMAEVPILLSLLITIRLRALAAVLAGTYFTKQKSEEWHTQVKITMEQITSSTSILTAGEFNLENCTGWVTSLETGEVSTGKHHTIIHGLLLQLISKLEAAYKAHYEVRFSSRKEPIAQGKCWTRTAILEKTLAKSSVSRSSLIWNESSRYLRSGGLNYEQAIYLALYSLIWDDLQHPSEPSKTHMVEEWNEISVEEFTDTIVMSMTEDAVDIPSLWSPSIMDTYWECWTSRILGRFQKFATHSDDGLASWLRSPARRTGTDLFIPKNIAFRFVHKKLRVNVRKIRQSPNVDFRSTKGALSSCIPSELLHMLTQVSNLHQQRCVSPNESSVSSWTPSFREFKKITLRRRQSATSQDMALPSSVIRRSLRSDWSFPWGDSISILSSRLSKVSLSTQTSQSSK
jgi:hypothetical protein